MALTRVVNGQIVALTPQEEADIRAEWARNEAAEQARQATQAQKVAQAQANRVTLEQVTGLTLDEIREVLRLG